MSPSSSRNDLLQLTADTEQESDHFHNLTTNASIEDSQQRAEEEALQEVSDNEQISFKNIRFLLERTVYLIFNLFSVYFLEYTIITSFADVMGQKMRNRHPDVC